MAPRRSARRVGLGLQGGPPLLGRCQLVGFPLDLLVEVGRRLRPLPLLLQLEGVLLELNNLHGGMLELSLDLGPRSVGHGTLPSELTHTTLSVRQILD